MQVKQWGWKETPLTVKDPDWRGWLQEEHSGRATWRVEQVVKPSENNKVGISMHRYHTFYSLHSTKVLTSLSVSQ